MTYVGGQHTLKFKGVSSRVLRKEFPELKELSKKFLWAPSCYHGSVGQGFNVVEKYIEAQKDHHDLSKYDKNKKRKRTREKY